MTQPELPFLIQLQALACKLNTLLKRYSGKSDWYFSENFLKFL